MYTQPVLTANRVSFEMKTYNCDNLPFKSIAMFAGDVEYAMMTVKANVLAVSLLDFLKTNLNIDLVVGMAFDFVASYEKGVLTTCADPRAVGIYARLNDLPRVVEFLQR
jgi:hypothetical protein